MNRILALFNVLCFLVMPGALVGASKLVDVYALDGPYLHKYGRLPVDEAAATRNFAHHSCCMPKGSEVHSLDELAKRVRRMKRGTRIVRGSSEPDFILLRTPSDFAFIQELCRQRGVEFFVPPPLPASLSQ